MAVTLFPASLLLIAVAAIACLCILPATVSGQIKFDRMVEIPAMMQVTSCHTCENAADEAECDMSSTRCPNMEDACMSVAWVYPDGRQRIYKRCVPAKHCQAADHTECVAARGIQRCMYCCWGKDCNRKTILGSSTPQWDNWE